MPLAWSMTARELSAAARCSARSSAPWYRWRFATGTTAAVANCAARRRVAGSQASDVRT
jgi:hypothetical protein